MHTLSDNQLLPDDIPEGPGEASLGTVNLLDIKSIFDTLAAAKHWFLHEIKIEEKEQFQIPLGD